MKKQQMVMTVNGEALTRLAQNMMLSDMPDSAWRAIESSVLGDPKTLRTVVFEVLDGDSAIHGDSSSGLWFDHQKVEAYQRELRRLYVGRTIISRVARRPVATLSVPAYMGVRCVYTYMRSRLGPDEIVRPVDGRWVVFEACGAPPFWWPRISEHDAVKDHLVIHGALPERVVVVDVKADRERHDREEREEEEMLDEERQLARLEKIEKIRAEVVRRAGDDTFKMPLADGRVLTVPRAPFEQWALGRIGKRELALPWIPVSPGGMKQQMDDEWHTDWLLGAGLSLAAAYDRVIMDAAIDAASQLQWSGRLEGLVVMSVGPTVTGIVGQDIAVLPDLSAKHQTRFLKAKAVIAETGGQLAHLAKVGRELRMPVLVIRNARKRYPKGTKLCIDAAAGSVVVG